MSNGPTSSVVIAVRIYRLRDAPNPAIASQNPICVRPTLPVPRIFPAMSSCALAAHINTSVMRELFSSMTERITITPYDKGAAQLVVHHRRIARVDRSKIDRLEYRCHVGGTAALLHHSLSG